MKVKLYIYIYLYLKLNLKFFLSLYLLYEKLFDIFGMIL